MRSVIPADCNFEVGIIWDEISPQRCNKVIRQLRNDIAGCHGSGRNKTSDGVSDPGAAYVIDDLMVPAAPELDVGRSWQLTIAASDATDAAFQNDTTSNWCQSPAFPELEYATGHYGTPTGGGGHVGAGGPGRAGPGHLGTGWGRTEPARAGPACRPATNCLRLALPAEAPRGSEA